MEQRVKARRLQRRIEYYELTAVPDGFGGSTVEETLIREYWAEIRSASQNIRTATENATLGIQDFSEVFIITVRGAVAFNEPKKYRVKFEGLGYEVLSVQTVDLRGTRTQLVVRQYRK